MRAFTAGTAGVLLILAGPIARKAPTWDGTAPDPAQVPARTALHTASTAVAPDIAPEDLTAVVQRYCQVCHNDQLLTGNLSLQGFDVANPVPQAETAEKVIHMLRVGMMPPPGMPRPGGDTLIALVEELEQQLERAAEANPNPGNRSFQRLNRAEYEVSIRDLLGLTVNAGDYLPPDTKSANFDNIADVQLLSPTLLDGYLRGAAAISKMAVGYPSATPSETQYLVPQWYSQVDRVEGAPFGTRGGTSVTHNFPANGEYRFRVSFHVKDTGELYGGGNSALHTADGAEEIEISIDGERVALLLEVDRWMTEEDPNGATMRTDPVFIRSGPRQVTAAFVKRYEGPLADLLSPHDWSISNTTIASEYGTLAVPHLREVVIGGPYNTTGVSETPSRQKIFTCRPITSSEAQPCAHQILSNLASSAFRRPVTADELEALMSFYDQGAANGGFEVSVRIGLEAILSSPSFVFRIERAAADPRSGDSYRINPFDLAARLSFFLWAGPPDEELVSLAREGRLSDQQTLEEQARRMLASPRSEALATRFAAQWLRLDDLEAIQPDVRVDADFHQQLKNAMRRETELFFYKLVQNDRNLLELFTADYTFVNERLAKHYGIPGVAGEEFRRVDYPDSSRRQGLFGHGSVLTLTSLASRTSPVLRGKWVMEVILGTPPPPPPPGIPDLEQTEGSTDDGRILTTRERMEVHRANPTCNACHRFMDPIGLALDNFDLTGRWRIRENGAPLDTRGELWDGSPVTSPTELQEALLKRSVPIIRNFTVNLMAYALGRRVEYYDMPAVRKIVRDAERNDYRLSSFVLGVVLSDAFQMRGAAATVTESSQGSL